jgi:hypothetical protein
MTEKIEQMYLNLDSDDKNEDGLIVIPYSERIQKPGETNEEYTERIIALNKKVVSGGHTWGKPTKDELAQVGNQKTEREGAKIEPSELHDSDITDKLTRHDPETQRRIDQMKRRRDIYD